MKKETVVSAIQKLAEDLSAATIIEGNVLFVYSKSALEYNERLAIDQAEGKRLDECSAVPILTCSVDESLGTAADIKTSVQEMGRSFHSNAVTEGSTYSVYSDAALQYNTQLTADHAVGKRMDCEPASPFLTCTIESTVITSTVSLNGIEGTADELQGLMALALANHHKNAYIFSCGGVLGLREADDFYNDTNRSITHGMQLLYKRPLIGSFNLSGEMRKEVACGAASPLQELSETVDASTLKNFFADFILPSPVPESQHLYDELSWLLRYWNSSMEQKQELLRSDYAWLSKGNEIDNMVNRIGALGGFLLHWT